MSVTSTLTPLFIINAVESPWPSIFVTTAPNTGLYIQGEPRSTDCRLEYQTLQSGICTYRNITFTLGIDKSLTYHYTISGGEKIETSALTAAPPIATLPSIIETGILHSSGSISSSRGPPLLTSSPPNSSPPNSTVPLRRPSSGNRIGAGAVAGIAVGCLVAGAIFAGLTTWFCLHRARRLRVQPKERSTVLGLMRQEEKGATAQVLSAASGSLDFQDATPTVLPQPLEDKAISAGLSGLGVAIKNHVQSFYHTGRASPGLLDLDDLQALGKHMPISIGTMSTLLGNSGTRELALRFCIAWVIVSRMRLSSEPEDTLLPREFAQCFQAMSSTGHVSHAQNMAFARWRALSTELMQATYVRNSFSPSDSRHLNVEKAIHALDGVLLPYSDSRRDNIQRLQNLREILKRAANFAFTLFSQPSTWDFDWQEQQGVLSGSLCVFPALVQVTDEVGEPVTPPRAFTEAIVRRLDG